MLSDQTQRGRSHFGSCKSEPRKNLNHLRGNSPSNSWRHSLEVVHLSEWPAWVWATVLRSFSGRHRESKKYSPEGTSVSLILISRGLGSVGGCFWWTTEVKIPRDWEALWRLHLLPLGQFFHLGWQRRKHVQMPVLAVNVVQWEKTWGGKHLRKARDFQQRLPLWAVTQWVEGKVTASLGMGVGGEGESVRWGWEAWALGVGWESVEWPRTIRLWICLTSPECWVLEIMEDYHNK